MMEQIIKVQDDYKSISTGIHVRKSNFLGTIPLDNPSAVQIVTPSKQSYKQGSPVNQPQMSQLHMAQILDLNLYQPVSPLKVIINKLSIGPEFATLFMYKKEEQSSTQKAHGYYEALSNKPVDFENSSNSQGKYYAKKGYVPKQRFFCKKQEE